MGINLNTDMRPNPQLPDNHIEKISRYQKSIGWKATKIGKSGLLMQDEQNYHRIGNINSYGNLKGHDSAVKKFLLANLDLNLKRLCREEKDHFMTFCQRLLVGTLHQHAIAIIVPFLFNHTRQDCRAGPSMPPFENWYIPTMTIDEFVTILLNNSIGEACTRY